MVRPATGWPARCILKDSGQWSVGVGVAYTYISAARLEIIIFKPIVDSGTSSVTVARTITEFNGGGDFLSVRVQLGTGRAFVRTARKWDRGTT